MTAEEIRQYLAELNDELGALDVKGEICLYGGAVMCLAFKARPATKERGCSFRAGARYRPSRLPYCRTP